MLLVSYIKELSVLVFIHFRPDYPYPFDLYTLLTGLLHDRVAGVRHARHPHHHAHPRAGGGLAAGQS